MTTIIVCTVICVASIALGVVLDVISTRRTTAQVIDFAISDADAIEMIVHVVEDLMRIDPAREEALEVTRLNLLDRQRLLRDRAQRMSRSHRVFGVGR